MRRLHFFLYFVLTAFLFADTVSSSNQTIVLPKPHDHTGKALDIMVKKDVMRFNYGKILYKKHCASCHHKERIGGKGPELSVRTLSRYRTISQLYLALKKGCPQSGASDFGKLGNVKLIFIARYIKQPLKKVTALSTSTLRGADK